jgi:hypothetical protein
VRCFRGAFPCDGPLQHCGLTRDKGPGVRDVPLELIKMLSKIISKSISGSNAMFPHGPFTGFREPSWGLIEGNTHLPRTGAAHFAANVLWGDFSIKSAAILGALFTTVVCSPSRQLSVGRFSMRVR